MQHVYSYNILTLHINTLNIYMEKEFPFYPSPLPSKSEKQLIRESKTIRRLLSAKALRESNGDRKITQADLRRMVRKKKVTSTYFNVEHYLAPF